MQNRFSTNTKHCDWCGSNFMLIKGRQSDMCPICWARYNSFLDTKKQLVVAQQATDELGKCLESITDYYQEQAKQGFKIPEELEVKK